jgi:hypothetical protein
MRLPAFRDIGNNLKDRFDGASRVLVSNDYRGLTRKKYKKVQLKPYETGKLSINYYFIFTQTILFYNLSFF